MTLSIVSSISCVLPIEFDNKIETIPALLIPTLGKEIILGMDFWNCFGIHPLKVSKVETCDRADDSVQLSIKQCRS